MIVEGTMVEIAGNR